MVIEAPGNSAEAFYIDRLTLDGKAWDKNYLEHKDLADGARLRFTMSAQPNTARGVSASSKPYSMSLSGGSQPADNQ